MTIDARITALTDAAEGLARQAHELVLAANALRAEYHQSLALASKAAAASAPATTEPEQQ